MQSQQERPPLRRLDEPDHRPLGNPKSVIVTLVITMVVAGQDVERQMPMTSIEQCEIEAHRTMEEMTGTRHADAKISEIGVGCVVKLGNPL
jgi:hypothetical protein